MTKLFASRRLAVASAVLIGLCCGALDGAQASSANRGYEWFWTEVPAQIARGDRDRALDVVAAAQEAGIAAPRAERAERILRRWWPEIAVAADAARVSEALLAALVMVESAGRPDAVSPVGAQGLGQLMPGTARSLGVRDSFDPVENLRGAALYLSDLIDFYQGDLVLSLAAYNAGRGAVSRYGGVPPFRETRAYVPKVLSAFATLGRICHEDQTRDARSICSIDHTL